MYATTTPDVTTLCDTLYHSVAMIEILEDAARGRMLTGNTMQADTVGAYASALAQTLRKAQTLAAEIDDCVLLPISSDAARQHLGT